MDHSLKWMATLEKSLGLQPHCFIVYRDDEPVALCPFFGRNIKRFKGLATLPRSDLNYLIVRDEPDRELVDFIKEQVFDMAKDERSAFVLMSYSNPELRDAFSNGVDTNRAFLPHHINGYMLLDLEELNPQHIWDNVFTHKGSQRKYIRRFEQAGYQTRETRSDEDLSQFYEHYSHNMVAKGMTPSSRSHFEYLLREYSPDELRMTLLEKDGQMAAGLITFFYPAKKTVYVRYSAPNKDESDNYFRRANLPLYWELINHAYAKGYRKICFGGTRPDPNDRIHQIKAGLGCKYQELYTTITPTSVLFSTMLRTHKFIEDKRSG
jgi:hypothetical protein